MLRASKRFLGVEEVGRASEFGNISQMLSTRVRKTMSPENAPLKQQKAKWIDLNRKFIRYISEFKHINNVLL